MARVHGKDLSTLTLNSQSLLADTISLTFSPKSATHDTTTMGDDWEEATAGLKSGDEISHELFYDNTNTTGSYYFICNLLGAAATTFSFADGTRTTSVSVIVTGVDLSMSVGDMMKIKASYKCTGAVTFA